MSRKQITFKDTRPDFENYLAHIQANRHPLSLLLDQVLDMRNLGSIFRLADAARLEKIYFYKMESLRFTTHFKRVARSTEQFVPYESLLSLDTIEMMKGTHHILALEWTNDSVKYNDLVINKPCLLIVGNEESGVSDEMLGIAHECIHIPMYGVKTSLNVAMATGIAVYELLQKIVN